MVPGDKTMLLDELRDITDAVMKCKPEWTEENWKNYHLRMVKGRLKSQANEGFHSCYFPHLTEEEEGYLASQGLNVTKKTQTCSCLYGNGWFVDWFDEGDLEQFQREVGEIYDDLEEND